jgi:1-acyl-sn-glycerol-3-phosphate acyltransferase
MKRSVLVDILLRPLITFIATVFFRLKTKNRKFISKGGLILAGNHISEWDPPFIAAAVPRGVYFMAKSEMFRTAFASSAYHALGAFPVNRSSSVNSDALKTAIDLVNDGKAVIMFPEGTRSKTGKLLPSKPGVGYVAHSTKATVVPFFISGTDHPVGAFFFKTRFSITFGQPITHEELERLHELGGPAESARYIMGKVKEMKEIAENKAKKGKKGTLNE